MRGMLTDKIQEKAVSFLNREITQKELRLYPYIDYSIKNGCYPMRRKTPCFSYGDIRRVHRIYASN